MVIESVAMLGFVFIAYAIFRLTSASPFPSYWAAIPVVGSAMVICAGLARPKGMAVWWLTTPPMIGIGIVSYAWYLWHWPMLVLARIYNFGSLTVYMGLLIGLLSFVFAVLTHLAVERPVLTWRKKRKVRLGWSPTFVGIAACLCAATIGSAFAYLLPPRILASSELLASINRGGGGSGKCQIGVMTDDEACRNYIAGRKLVLIFGDSHAGVSIGSIEAAFPETAFATLAYPNCPSMFDVSVVGFSAVSDAACVEAKSRGLNWMEGSIKPESAILISLWRMYGKWTGEPIAGEFGRFLAEVGAVSPAPSQSDFYRRKLTKTIEKLLGLGVKRIGIVAPVAEMPRVSPDCVARALKFGFDVDQLCSVTLTSAQSRRAGAMEVLNAVAAQFPEVRIIDPFPVACDDIWCRPYKLSTMLYLDWNHLLPPGVRGVISTNQETFDWLVDDTPLARHAAGK